MSAKKGVVTFVQTVLIVVLGNIDPGPFRIVIMFSLAAMMGVYRAICERELKRTKRVLTGELLKAKQETEALRLSFFTSVSKNIEERKN